MINALVSDPQSRSVDDVADRLQTDLERGLTEREATERLKRYGPNELAKPKKKSIWLLFLFQFHSRLTYVLFAAALISFVSGQNNDAYGILLAVLIDAVFGFWQERKAESAIEKLRAMVVLESKVVREGRLVRVRTAEVVPGDLLILEEGDRVSADCRIVSSRDLRIDESSLTGESVPVRKEVEEVALGTDRADMSDMAWLGTSVSAGIGRGLVTATGQQTVFGAIATSLSTIEEEPAPLEARLDKLGQTLGLLSVGLAGLVFVFGFFFDGIPLREMFFFAVALVVSVIPEGLPAVLAVVLAIGIRRMAKRRAIVRHVPSVETLGVADVICTDKTGTLTENRMTVQKVFVAGREWTLGSNDTLMAEQADDPQSDGALMELLRTATVCNRASLPVGGSDDKGVGDPTEVALVALGSRVGLDKKRLLGERAQPLDEIPFSSTRRYQARLVDGWSGNGQLLLAVGAYEVLQERSSSVSVAGGDASSGPAFEQLSQAAERLGESAMRVLAVARKKVPVGQTTIDESDVKDLELLGLVGLADPAREGVDEAVRQCHRAGVRVIMVTGDHRSTALAIARQVGIVGPDLPDGVLADSDVVGLSDEQLDLALERTAVFARVSPETKLRIVDRLESAGHIVAMTGDGVNDAPALKRASIGVSMGITGTDVSKEVADMVLADDNFVTIVSAIEEGRIIFRNVRQTVAYLFMTNIGEVVTVLVGLALRLPLPLLPAQILWMNLVTDGLPDVALATERRSGSVLEQPPRGRHEPILGRDVFILTALTSVLMCVGTLSLFVWHLSHGEEDLARTVAFTTMACFQLWNVFNMRTVRESLFQVGLFSNRYVFWSVVVSFGLQLAVIYLPPLQRIFRTVPIGWAEWLLILAVTALMVPIVEVFKLVRRRREARLVRV